MELLSSELLAGFDDCKRISVQINADIFFNAKNSTQGKLIA